MLLENLNKFIKYYGNGRKIKLLGFGFLSFIAGCFEFLGVALVYPFIMLIIKPDYIDISKYIKIDNPVTLGLIIGLLVLLIFISKNIYIIFTLYIQNKFTSNWKKDIAQTYMQYYIYAPYRDIMRNSTNDKIYIINNLATSVIDGFVFRLLNLLINSTIIFMVITLLLTKFLIPAIVTSAFAIVAITLQNKFFKNKTTKIAEELANKSQSYNNATLNNIYNLKEIRILSSEDVFFDNFKKEAEGIKNILADYGFYAAMPPYIIEILVVFALIIMAYILSIQTGSNNASLIASYAIVVAALFRIAPALNRIQSSVININSSRNLVKMLNEEYEKCNLKNVKILYHSSSAEKLEFNHNISLKNVCFSYNERKQVIKNVSFDICKGDFIGIIGLSGAGKSTLADIITGLLPVDSGEIYIDNTELTENNFYKFRNIIGYIPQQINVLDKSIRENIAWGCKEIDDEKVKKALEKACLYDVIKEYPDGIYSRLAASSNNGLSQGQKQRLAIARALYREPEILILDEATSSLDVQVEQEITNMLTKIGTTETIIAIAHRLSTLKACNKLVYMKDGQIVDIGTFEELSAKYPEFENLLKLSNIN